MNKSFKIVLGLATVALLTACQVSITKLSSTGSKHFTLEQSAYLKSDNISDTSPYNGNMSLSAPEPTLLKWSAQNEKNFKVEIATDEAMNDVVATYEVKGKELKFYNEQLLTKYYWRVTDSKSQTKSEVASFKNTIEVAGPRNLYVDGVENFRDIGGWGKMTDSGYQRYMKQGMVYRSGRFNEDKAETVNVTISEEGLKEVQNHLKIKTEIDLRRSGTNEIGSIKKSVLGDNVTYYNIPMIFEGKNLIDWKGTPIGETYYYDNAAAVKRVFEILADANNYPINFHCSIGKDRTGCIAYLLEGLLGFDKEVMDRDYMFTNFANAGMCKLDADIYATGRYGKTLMEYTNGETINDKIYNYLRDEIGVEEEKLDNIISILKVDYIDSLN